MVTLAELGIRPGECAVVVEAGNCNGNVEWAMEAIDAALTAGAWGFKGQFYHRDQLVTETASTYGHEGLAEPSTQWDHFATQLSDDEWREVADYATWRGLTFFASVFDPAAVVLAESIDIPLYKIASADITHKPLIQMVARTGKPIVLSTGGATLGEISRAYQWIKDIDSDLEILPLVCTLAYPCPPDQAHLNRLVWWRDNVGPFVGYSDHTEGISAMCTARAAGAVMIEKHFTVTPGQGGDHNFAATPQKLDVFGSMPEIIEGPNYEVEGGSSTFGSIAAERAAVASARRSIAAAVDLPKGHVIGENDLVFLRPGTGAYEPWQTDDVIGKTLPGTVAAGTLIPPLDDRIVTARATVTANLTVE